MYNGYHTVSYLLRKLQLCNNHKAKSQHFEEDTVISFMVWRVYVLIHCFTGENEKERKTQFHGIVVVYHVVILCLSVLKMKSYISL